MNYETVHYRLPAHWASALINGDRTGLDHVDERELDTFMAGEALPDPVSCSEEGEFDPCHDATLYGVLPCYCLEYAFLLPSDPNPDADR